MFNSICTFPLPSDLLAQAVHPNSPLVALGLASGHVQLQQLPALPENLSPRSKAKSPSTNGHGTIETVWRTRRHKDAIVKFATTQTGQVAGKIAVPSPHAQPDNPTLLHALSPQTLLLATDSSALHIYDLRDRSTLQNAKPQQSHNPHEDYISSLAPLTPSESSTSGFSRQWFSTGGSTVAITDVRKGVVHQSDDLGEEILSGTVVGNRCLAGGEKGALRMWEGGLKGLTEGVDRKITLQKGESLDIMCPSSGGADIIAVGLGDGSIRFVPADGKRESVVEGVKHDEVEGVVTLGLESGGRLISGGGSIVKIWERNTIDDEDDEQADGTDHDSDDVDGADGVKEDQSEDESSEEEKRPKRKKRKRNKGKDRGGNSHIMAFKGMD
ncbi:MAG: hypothetical protein Q9182_006521 [Xanthomendoza sp. 2 TL-2023]